MSDRLDITFGHILGFVRRGFIPAVLLAVLASGYAYVTSSRKPPTFEAEAVAYASQPAINQSAFGLPQLQPPLHITAYSVAALSGPVLANTLQSLGKPSTANAVDSFRRKVSVSTDVVAGLLYVKAKASTAKEAAEEANAVVAETVRWDQQRVVQELSDVRSSLEASTAALSKAVAGLQSSSNASSAEIVAQTTLLAQQLAQLATVKALQSKANGNLALLRPALPSASSVAPMPVFSAAVAALVALLLVYAVLFVREMFDARVYTAEDLARIGGLPVLASLGAPRGRNTLPLESATMLRTSLAAIVGSFPPKILHIASSDANQDATRVALALAQSYAANGLKTLLVDADLRNPQLARLHARDANPAKILSRILRRHAEAAPTALIRINGSGLLHLVFDLQPVDDAAQLIDGSFGSFLEGWASLYDVTVVVSPPMLTASESGTIASLGTGSILVGKIGRTSLRRVQGAIELLERSGARALGLVAVVRRGGRSSRPAPSPEAEARSTQVNLEAVAAGETPPAPPS